MIHIDKSRLVGDHDPIRLIDQIRKDSDKKVERDLHRLDEAGYFNNAKDLYAPSLVIDNMIHDHETQTDHNKKLMELVRENNEQRQYSVAEIVDRLIQHSK